MRNWFGTLLIICTGFALSLIISLIVAQTSYVGIQAPVIALKEPNVLHAIYLSLITATPASLLALLFAIPCSYGLARYRFPGHMLVDAILDIPVILSPVALGFSLLLLFRSSPGQWIENHFAQFIFAVPGIMLAQFILAFALATRVLKATFEEIPCRLEQVARFLGCSPGQAFFRVSLPLARRGIFAAFILGWARAIGDYGATVTIAGATPYKTETIPISIFLNMNAVRHEQAVALMLVLTGVALMVLLLSRIILGGSSSKSGVEGR